MILLKNDGLPKNFDPVQAAASKLKCMLLRVHVAFVIVLLLFSFVRLILGMFL
jgi:hypothetical protein